MNFVALLGWAPEGDREIFSLEELVKEFDYKKINKSPSVFDYTKLKWMNGEYIKAMDDARFKELAGPYLDKYLKPGLDRDKIGAMVKTRIEIFPEIEGLVDFFNELPEYDTEMYCH